jgi:hypothetical protein
MESLRARIVGEERRFNNSQVHSKSRSVTTTISPMLILTGTLPWLVTNRVKEDISEEEEFSQEATSVVELI